MKKISLILLLILVVSCSAQKDSDWQELFNGKDLDGWTVMGTDATFEIDGNTVIGTNHGRQNTFLATNRIYQDFILELEVWVDPRMNSGIQFRSAQNENGRVYGYQAEIDPSERAYSGGIYDEARRGWLYPLSLNPQGQSAFKNNEWNLYRIEAIGNSIRIFVNGINTAKMADDVSLEGFIALQVHGVGREEDEGHQVKWRNVKLATEYLKDKRKPVQEDTYTLNLLNNQLTEGEINEGWELLWNGKDLQGWNTASEQAWEMNNGMLVPKQGNAHLVSEEQFENFELSLRYKLSEGGKGGVGYAASSSEGNFGAYRGQEFQIVDHAILQEGMEMQKQGALFSEIAPENLSFAGMGERYLRGLGEWNDARIIVLGNKVEHWINGFKLVQYELTDTHLGSILLQNEGPGVAYQSIRIKRY